MIYQFLTAVVFDMCLQGFMTDRSGSLVYRSKCQAVCLAWPKQNISALSIAVESPVIMSGFAVLTKFHEPMRLDTNMSWVGLYHLLIRQLHFFAKLP